MSLSVLVLLSASSCQARPSFVEPTGHGLNDFFTRAARQLLVTPVSCGV